MALAPENAAWFAETFARLTDNIGQAVLGKAPVVRLALTCLLAEGHMLLEDAPGTGKTALARALAATMQCSNSRIQFTPDLLPSDITGVTIFDQKRSAWEFHRGPIFASIVLADEINRASPKTQSALLEIMGESQVTVDGTRYDAARPFMVIATQNPIEQAGTYRLPEAQLDRFLMKTRLGYPERAAAIEVLAGSARPDRSAQLRPIIATKAITDMVEMVKDNHVDPAVLDYVQRLVEATRDHPDTALGVSTRGAIAMVRAARVWAAAHGRNYVLSDDIKELVEPVWTHRLILSPDVDLHAATPTTVLARVLDEVAAPMMRA
ncbi:MAG: MoxR family ATPase [Tetrasphaera sp.]|jgi:MoxR-like ATPase|nr:MoxR family ATPase [Tetrasphaera sp.]